MRGGNLRRTGTGRDDHSGSGNGFGQRLVASSAAGQRRGGSVPPQPLPTDPRKGTGNGPKNVVSAAGARMVRGEPAGRGGRGGEVTGGGSFSSSVGTGGRQRSFEEDPSARAPPVPQHSAPFHNELLMAIRRRGGYWGLRGLRIALAKQFQKYRADASSFSVQPMARREDGVGGAPPIGLSQQPPTPTSLPLCPYVMDALREFQTVGPTLGVGFSGGLGGGGGFGGGGSTTLLPQQALDSPQYVLYWLGPEVVQKTCSVQVQQSGGGGGRDASSATVEEPKSPIIVVNESTRTSSLSDNSKALGEDDARSPHLYQSNLQPTCNSSSSSQNNHYDPYATSSRSIGGHTHHAVATRGRSLPLRSVPPITAAMRPSSVKAGISSIFADEEEVSFISRCFLDIDLFMRLLGCWLTPSQRQVIQGCYTILSERHGREARNIAAYDSAFSYNGTGGKGGSFLEIIVPTLGRPSASSDQYVLSISDLMRVVNITRHPDCQEGRARADNALARFFYLWGIVAPPPTPSCAARRMGGGLNMDVAVGAVGQFGNGAFVGVGSGTRQGGVHASEAFARAIPNGRTGVSSSVFSGSFQPSTTAPVRTSVTLELFCQFHADLLVSFSDVEFANMLPSMWGLTKDELSALPTPKPPLTRATSDKLFNEVDNNKNGILSLAELDGAIVARYPQYNYKPLIMRAYKLADKNRSGHISRTEFHRFLVYIAHLKHFSDLFLKIDTDRSKSISLDELVAAKSLLGLSDAPNSRLRILFLEIDRNRQGKILFDEFVEALLRKYPPPELSS